MNAVQLATLSTIFETLNRVRPGHLINLFNTDLRYNILNLRYFLNTNRGVCVEIRV